MKLDRIRIVLVESQGGLNIGSVARAMRNFGLSDLALVNPQVDPLGEDARKMALKALPILEGATRHPDLVSALADCRLAIGTTRRFGKYRENFLHPEGAAERLLAASEDGPAALVFGREDRGLTTAELDLCQRFVTIPTGTETPSLNLAQAVVVCLYEVARAGHGRARREGGNQRLAAGRTLEDMYDQMRKVLVAAGYLDAQNPDHILHDFRRIFGRAGLDDREVRILRGLWSRIAWLESERARLAGEKR